MSLETCLLLVITSWSLFFLPNCATEKKAVGVVLFSKDIKAKSKC